MEVARLRGELTKPENRLLSRFFEANRFDHVSLLHQLHSAEASASNLREINSVQQNTELLEVLILSVYATELAHVIAGDTVHQVWPKWAIGYYALAALGTGVAAYVLSPNDNAEKKRPKAALLGLALWFIVVITLGALRP